ncbi:MAG: hypothetical protein Q4E87_09470 [bacterium]|nr:hypothetical protein [bacterium]
MGTPKLTAKAVIFFAILGQNFSQQLKSLVMTCISAYSVSLAIIKFCKLGLKSLSKIGVENRHRN